MFLKKEYLYLKKKKKWSSWVWKKGVLKRKKKNSNRQATISGNPTRECLTCTKNQQAPGCLLKKEASAKVKWPTCYLGPWTVQTLARLVWLGSLFPPSGQESSPLPSALYHRLNPPSSRPFQFPRWAMGYQWEKPN